MATVDRALLVRLPVEEVLAGEPAPVEPVVPTVAWSDMRHPVNVISCD